MNKSEIRELTLEELAEIHITMLCRRSELLEDRKTIDSKILMEINTRQLERVTPICHYIEAAMNERSTVGA
jgi:hypothetical protein